MKIALINIKLRAKPSSSIQDDQQQKNRKPKPQKESEERNKKANMETHLTVSGVCTTVRPEKSGT
jgi:hypothetical protein